MFEDLVDTIGSLEPDNLIRRLRALEAERRRVEAEVALVVGAIDRRGIHRIDGHASVRGLLRAELAWSDGDATNAARVARLVAEEPVVGAALCDGGVGVAQVRLLARARANPRCGSQLAEHLALLLDHARTLPFEDFGLCVRRWEQLADADGAHRTAEATHAARTATFTNHDGVGRLTAAGGSLESAEMHEIWQRFCDAELIADWTTTRAAWGDAAGAALLPRTDAQRRWDALRQVFRGAAATPADARRPEPVVNIVIDLATFEATLAQLGLAPQPGTGPFPAVPTPPIHRWRCETSSGVLVDPVAAVAAAFQGHVRRVLCDSDGTVIDLGRRRRVFTGAARDAVRLLATRCVWPGCLIAVGRCQSDHVRDWQDNGPTSPANGAPLCGRHNRFKTGGYRIWRDPEGHWHTYRPDGTEIGQPVASWVDPAAASGRPGRADGAG